MDVIINQEKLLRLKSFLIHVLGELGGKKRFRNLMRINSLKIYIFKFGKERGTDKFNLYRNNKSEKSKKMWEDPDIRAKMALRGTLQFYVDKYGEEEGSIRYKEKNSKLSVGEESLRRRGYSEQQIQKIKSAHSKKSSHSLENYIEKYGEQDGYIKYNEIRKKGKSVWRFQDVMELYGVTEIEAKKMVAEKQSRGLEWYIKKYGDEQGRAKFDFANLRRSYANTKEYYIEKYGEELGIKEYALRIFKTSSASRIEHWIEKYGEELGIQKYQEYQLKKVNCFPNRTSRIELRFVNELIHCLDDDLRINVFSGQTQQKFLNFSINEFGIYVMVPDFKLFNIIIEFDGTFWHGSDAVKTRDAQKDILLLRNGFKSLRITEEEYSNNSDLTMQKCIQFIKSNLDKNFKTKGIY